jgi:deoxyribodipyrimidine photo-lyase
MQNHITKIKNGIEGDGNIIYWMSRDQRINDNWALIYAQQMAIERKTGLEIIFCLATNFLGATKRQFSFMLNGLNELVQKCNDLNIHFTLLKGNVVENICKYIDKTKPCLLITDFDPIRIKRQWQKSVSENINISFYEVDAHNIIPCKLLSDKQEYAAYTIRPKINRLLNDYLTDFPKFEKHEFNNNVNNSEIIMELSNYGDAPTMVKDFNSGENAAKKVLDIFIRQKLSNYNEFRNDPSLNYQSNLSPYLHFGQISAQRIVLEINRVEGFEESKNAFLEELIVRRELSDNFCYYNQNYDSFIGFPEWAKLSLNLHRNDKRDYIYSLEQFENGLTHDKYWNASQFEMIKTGKMHGYMRMYWAKKILEWSRSSEEALDIAIYLNDKYELDGRDPNGYTGIAWAIGGVHDRSWFERPVYGKIRYMNDSGLRRKFDIDKYKAQINSMI